MSEISASGFTGIFTIRTFSDPDLYAFAGRLVGLGYSVAEIKISGMSGYAYIPVDGEGSFAKKNYSQIFYQPRTFTVVSNDFGNFQLASGELVRALRESGIGAVDYAELSVSFEKVLEIEFVRSGDWDIRGFTISKNPIDSKKYEQISLTRINDELKRYMISFYVRGNYEEVTTQIQMLKAKMDEISDFLNSFLISLFKSQRQVNNTNIIKTEGGDLNGST
ncbi:hypothetical protein [Sulfurisphaera ohwakuensis]|uniref:Uncharacterized protein n=1 Tax=Sulfurisphaera ohwakuensis TaxID=69656 RepID=A0A650CGJ6_SULOH|nr:hypothetical protein [Sulfurisphaera ohwakuensis]MBB5252711.1 hypothetical protein [Sulfurisphaera ohwakuensis]QGR16868.1 hypothetical protein D1869_06500 [Sulfurisphaera ohwakuensis]